MLDAFLKIFNLIYVALTQFRSGTSQPRNNNQLNNGNINIGGIAIGITDIGGGTNGNQIKIKNPLGEDNIIAIISNILDWLIIYSIPILAIMILIGGFQILTAQDKPEQITKGKKTIMYAVIGFVIILISKGVALILLNILE